ncbi:CPBP family intramembrane metalloprotease [Haloarcula sp. S1AR25-5A]|uniref:CPBP family intramembrane metalloprotease n=1 Tax=Haloarcula terrestris TaxID=2950533 RepID=A0AAE4JJR8_9EURY|nr:CPBP family intramembrane glutamic endopeptidase [Haloarcula terrestris]MDS0222276.1 CPBP family intramembrane metalloprotease [Haloarcula terrestris]
MRQQIRERVDAHPVAAFFAFAYAISWVAWLGPVLELSEPVETVGFIVGGYGPFLAALVVTWLGSDSVQAWSRQIVDWRVAPRWYIAAVTLPLLIIALTSVGLTVVGTSVDPGLLPERVTLVFASFVTIALVGGGNEEPGWRGLALPKLQERSAPVPATLILGVVWAFWHLPLLATGPTTFHGLASFVEVAPTTTVRILNIVGVAFILTWVYNGTGSVLLAILAHTGFNTANNTLVPLPLDIISAGDSTTILVVTTVAIWVVVAVLLVVTHGRLGYEAEPDTVTTPTLDHSSEIQ